MANIQLTNLNSIRNFTDIQLKNAEDLWEALRSKTKGDGYISNEENDLMTQLGRVIRMYKDGKLNTAQEEIFTKIDKVEPGDASANAYNLYSEEDGKLVICEQNIHALCPNMHEFYKQVYNDYGITETKMMLAMVKDLVHLIKLEKNGEI